MHWDFSWTFRAAFAALVFAAESNSASAQEAVNSNGAVPEELTKSTASPASDDAAALAKKLSNPVASLISVPFQFNYDGNIGPTRSGDRITLNIQPVVPVKLNDDWNVVSRTIVPIVWQNNIAPGTGNQFGLGDTVQSFFFTPAKAGGFIWGAGPVLLVPTGTDNLLSGKKWGGGLTAVVLKQMNGWTVGGLANHIWSFAGSDARGDISATFLNPFVSHTSKSAFTYGFSADIAYDWKSDKVVIPLTASASQLTKIGGQLVSIGGAVRYYVATTSSSPHGLAARFSLSLLFPK